MKIIYLILFTLFIISTSQAQLIRGYGIKAGATLASEDWDYSRLITDFKSDSRWGFNLGVFSEFLNIPYFSLVGELNYVQKGMKDQIIVTKPADPYVSQFITSDTRVDYLNLRALGKFRYEFQSFIPYILLGPKIDFQINEETSPASVNVAKNFNEVMYGFKIGIGSEVKFDSFSLLAEILYDYNFNDLYEGEYLTVTSDSFDFRIGIMF